MKKSVFMLALTILMISVMSMTAFAHGHGGGHRAVQQPRRTANATYAVCTVDGCNLYGVHAHNGTYYNCAPHSAGHSHYRR